MKRKCKRYVIQNTVISGVVSLFGFISIYLYINYSDLFMFIYDLLSHSVLFVFPFHYEPLSCWTNGPTVWIDLITGSVCYIFCQWRSRHGDIGAVYLSWLRSVAVSFPVPDSFYLYVLALHIYIQFCYFWSCFAVRLYFHLPIYQLQ